MPVTEAPPQPPSLYLTLPDFEGPLDLLLKLLEREALPITAVSLALLTDQYLEYVRSLSDRRADGLASFLEVASRLLLLKSRLLLPRAGSSVDESESDEGADLVQRLETYQRLREAAERLAEREILEQHCFTAQQPPYTPLEAPFQPPTVGELAQALRGVLVRYARVRQLQEFRKPDPHISIAERIAVLLEQLIVRRRALFQEIGGDTPPLVVVSFLAVLELARQNVVAVQQEAPFAPIVVELQG